MGRDDTQMTPPADDWQRVESCGGTGGVAAFSGNPNPNPNPNRFTQPPNPPSQPLYSL